MYHFSKIILQILVVFFILKCTFNEPATTQSINSNPPAANNPNDTISPVIPTPLEGYAMLFQKIETKLPNEVKVFFQVVDLNGVGVANLNAADFEVFENDAPLSSAESQLTINNLSTINHKIKTVLLLDNSTSVESEIEQIRNSAKNIVSGIRNNHEFAVFQFSENLQMLQNFTSDVQTLNNVLDNQFVQGVKTTDFYGAVIKGSGYWRDSSNINAILNGNMVIISDGNDTQGSNKLAEALHAVKNKLVYTIGLGNEIQPEILNAFGTGGYFPIGNEDGVKNKFAEIESSVLKFANSFYELTYLSPKRGNVSHTLVIRIKNNPHEGDRAYIQTMFNSAGFN